VFTPITRSVITDECLQSKGRMVHSIRVQTCGYGSKTVWSL